jgi:glyoxylase-like metal-dependent hydrolase (beta-lactamase superfamily II)
MNKKIISLFIYFIYGSLTATAQDQSVGQVPENAVTQLGSHTFYIPDQGRPAVPNVGIVVGENATLVIDPGLGRKSGETVLKQLAGISDNNKIFIATTHFHPEHTTGYIAFPDSAVYINSEIQEEDFADRGQRVIDLFSSRNPIMAELLTDAERRVADITFDKEYSLDLGGVTVRFLVVGPTHTRGDTGFFVEQDKILFSGDVVMKDSFWTAFPDTASTGAWLNAFDRFEAFSPEIIVPSHGPIGDGPLIQVQRTALEKIRDQAIAFKRQGMTRSETGVLVRQQIESAYPDWLRSVGITALAESAWQEAK